MADETVFELKLTSDVTQGAPPGAPAAPSATPTTAPSLMAQIEAADLQRMATRQRMAELDRQNAAQIAAQSRQQMEHGARMAGRPMPGPGPGPGPATEMGPPSPAAAEPAGAPVTAPDAAARDAAEEEFMGLGERMATLMGLTFEDKWYELAENMRALSLPELTAAIAEAKAQLATSAAPGTTPSPAPAEPVAPAAETGPRPPPPPPPPSEPFGPPEAFMDREVTAARERAANIIMQEGLISAKALGLGYHDAVATLNASIEAASSGNLVVAAKQVQEGPAVTPHEDTAAGMRQALQNALLLADSEKALALALDEEVRQRNLQVPLLAQATRYEEDLLKVGEQTIRYKAAEVKALEAAAAMRDAEQRKESDKRERTAAQAAYQDVYGTASKQETDDAKQARDKEMADRLKGAGEYGAIGFGMQQAGIPGGKLVTGAASGYAGGAKTGAALGLEGSALAMAGPVGAAIAVVQVIGDTIQKGMQSAFGIANKIATDDAMGFGRAVTDLTSNIPLVGGVISTFTGGLFDLMEGIHQTTVKLSAYNADLTRSLVEFDIRQLQRDIRRAETMGPQLLAAEQSRQEIQEQLQQLMDDIMPDLLAAVKTVGPMIVPLVKDIIFTLKAMAFVINPIGSVVAAIQGNTAELVDQNRRDEDNTNDEIFVREFLNMAVPGAPGGTNPQEQGRRDGLAGQGTAPAFPGI